MARLLIVMVLSLAAAASAARVGASDKDVPGPENLASYYTNWPQPIPLAEYARAPFKCEGKFALCAYAVCVPIENSNPLVAECGCLEFDQESFGTSGSTSMLNEKVANKMKKECSNSTCTTGELFNKSAFCKAMNDGTMYPGYPLVSTFNNTAWIDYIGETEAPTPTVCMEGGTFADCYTAACRRGPPTSEFLSKTVNGKPLTATCYCPIYTTKQPFLLPMNGTCGPTAADEVKPDTIILNSG